MKVREIPELDPDSAKVLMAIKERGVVRGSELLRLAGLTDAKQLAAAVKPLLNEELISASGITLDPEQATQVYYSIRPPAAFLAEQAIAKAMTK